MSPGRRFALVFAIACAVYVPTVRHRNLKDCGGSSRMATVESLVERGTLAIDGSTFAYTCDRMKKEGHLYSDKPPLLSVAAAGVYALLHHGLGLAFNRAADPGVNALHDHTYALMTVLVVVLAQALLVATFDRAAGCLGVAGARRLVATGAAALATPLWPLTALFNSHNVAAVLLLGGWYLAWVSPSRCPALAGLALGLLAAVDLPLGLIALAVTLLLEPARLALVAGALAPIAAHAVFNVWIAGDLVPIQMHRELYDETTGHAGTSATGFAQDAGLVFYAARNLVGSLGVFSLTPLAALVLLLAAREAASPERGSGTSPAGRKLALAATLVLVASAVVYVVVWPEAVGCSYGMRHVAPALPPVLLVGAAVAARTRAAWRGFVALAALSAVLAAGGLLSPATCAGFVEDARGYVAARVFIENLRDGLRAR